MGTVHVHSVSRLCVHCRTEHQWGPSLPTVKTGGENFMKMQIQPKTLQPMQVRGGRRGEGERGRREHGEGGRVSAHKCRMLVCM